MSLSGRSASTWPEPLNELLPLLAKLAFVRIQRIFFVRHFVSKQSRMISALNTKKTTFVLFKGSLKTFAVNLAMLLIFLSKLTTLAYDKLTVNTECSERQFTSFAILFYSTQ